MAKGTCLGVLLVCILVPYVYTPPVTAAMDIHLHILGDGDMSMLHKGAFHLRVELFDLGITTVD